MEDILQMQQEAARRVRRMQEHSRRVFEEHRDGFAPPSHPAAPPLYVAASIDESPRSPTPPLPGTAPIAEAASLVPDTEQWLLIGLAILLFRSGSRPELIAALLYLAM